MVTIVFTAGSNALDMTKAEQDLLKERVILQLRMLAKGGDFAAHKEKNDAKIDRTFRLKQNTRISAGVALSKKGNYLPSQALIASKRAFTLLLESPLK